jgi:phosphonate ABC transporter substrate-binding protein
MLLFWLRIFLLGSAGFLYSIFACAEANVFSKYELRIGFDLTALPDISRTDLEVSMQYWASEISAQAEVPITVKVYDRYSKAMVEDFKQGATNFLFTAPINFVGLLNEHILADGFAAVQDGLHLDSLILLTRRSAGVDRFEQLLGKRITLLKNDAFQTVYLEDRCSKVFHDPCSQSLNFTSSVNNSHRQILKLFFGDTDAVLVRKASFAIASELNPQIGRSLQIVEEFPGVPMGVGYFHVAVPEKIRESIISKAVNLANYRRGRNVLEIFMADTIERSLLTDLQSVAEVYSRFQQLYGSR